MNDDLRREWDNLCAWVALLCSAMVAGSQGACEPRDSRVSRGKPRFTSSCGHWSDMFFIVRLCLPSAHRYASDTRFYPRRKS